METLLKKIQHELINEINKRALNENRIIDCLLQIHIAKEKNKFGFKINEIENVIERSKNLKNINIIGLMGMATFSKNQDDIKNFPQINATIQQTNQIDDKKNMDYGSEQRYW